MTEEHIPEPEVTPGTFEEGKAEARRLFALDPGSQCPRTSPVPSDFKSGLEQQWMQLLVEHNAE